MDTLTNGCMWLLVFIFALGGTEKLQTLHQGTARWHPVALQLGPLRRHAGPLLAISAIADGLMIAVLLSEGQAGGFIAIALLAAYSVPGFRALRGEASRCECLPGPFDTSIRPTFVARNGALGVAALAVVLADSSTTLAGLILAAVLALLLAGAIQAFERSHGGHKLGEPGERVT